MTDIPDTEHTPRDFGDVADENDYTAARRAEKRPCSCWQQVNLHSGHCCFDHPDHSYDPDVPLPCGHTDPREQP